LMPASKNHHTSSLTYRRCCKCLNTGKKPFNAQFSILNDEKTLQLYGNASRSQLNVAIRTRLYPEMHCTISWWFTLSPPCGPTANTYISY
jgi:hypothetical protein